MMKKQLGKKAFTQLTAPQHSPCLRKVRAGMQGSNPEAGVTAETVEGWLVLRDLFILLS